MWIIIPECGENLVHVRIQYGKKNGNTFQECGLNSTGICYKLCCNLSSLLQLLSMQIVYQCDGIIAKIFPHYLLLKLFYHWQILRRLHFLLLKKWKVIIKQILKHEHFLIFCLVHSVWSHLQWLSFEVTWK